MRRATSLSIAVMPILIVTTLPNGARGGPFAERAELIWSSRDGLLRPNHADASTTDVETRGERSGDDVDPHLSRSQGVLICEPFR